MLKKLILIVAILGIFLVGYSLIEPYLIETKDITISSNQIPAEFDGKRIVFITDVHYGPFFSKERVDSLVNQTNALKPDMILLGGDYVTNDPANVGPVFSSLSKLKAPLGVYGVLGNNDPKNVSIQAMQNAGITYIGNGGVWIGSSNTSRIRVGGVADMDTNVPNQLPILEGVTPEDFVILVTHKPDYFPKVSRSRVDLVLAGHTHGGQITLFGLYAPLISSEYGQEYVTGEKKLGNDTMIISNGIGMVWAPVRFFARPQIIVITLKRTS
jgi:predicted MPP superfamily phosphohydrolase